MICFFLFVPAVFIPLPVPTFVKISVPVPDPNLDQNHDSNLDPVPDLIQHSFRTKFLQNLLF